MIPRLVLLLVLGVLPVSGHQAPAAEQKQEKQKEQKADEFVLAGTVLTEQGFALSGAAIRVRRTGEKKVREKAQSDRRGEFALRLRPGLEYEVTVEAKGYEPQTKKFAAEIGAVNNFVFRMRPVGSTKETSRETNAADADRGAIARRGGGRSASAGRPRIAAAHGARYGDR